MNSYRPMRGLVTKPNHLSLQCRLCTYSNLMLVCVSLWFQMLYGGMLINIFYKYCCKTPRSGNDTAQRWCSANHRHPSILWQVSTRDSTSADMHHPVHGTARLTKSTHYCCQLLALPLNINGQQQCINLENTNIGYIWRTSPIRTDTKLACVAALPVCRSPQVEGWPTPCASYSIPL